MVGGLLGQKRRFVQLNTVMGHLIVKTVLLWKIVGRSEGKDPDNKERRISSFQGPCLRVLGECFWSSVPSHHFVPSPSSSPSLGRAQHGSRANQGSTGNISL